MGARDGVGGGGSAGPLCFGREGRRDREDEGFVFDACARRRKGKGKRKGKRREEAAASQAHGFLLRREGRDARVHASRGDADDCAAGGGFVGGTLPAPRR